MLTCLAAGNSDAGESASPGESAGISAGQSFCFRLPHWLLWLPVLLSCFLDNSGFSVADDRQEKPLRSSISEAASVKNATGKKTDNETTLRVIPEDAQLPAFSRGPLARTADVAGDCTLNDVCHVGQFCWAAGDRGVLLRSRDAGVTWTESVLPTDCSLRSVCFLTDRIGWIAGVRFDSTGQSQSRALLMQTRDGGDTWADLSAMRGDSILNSQTDGVSSTGGSGSIATSQLPGILDLTYFELDQAVAVTLPMQTQASATLFRSEDGGRTWNPVPCDHPHARWNTAAFLSFGEGVAGGERMAHATIVSNQAITAGAPAASLRQVRGLTLSPSGNAWMVGDGGLAMVSSNAGVSWKPVAFQLPEQQERLFDFRTVAQRDSLVLMAGSPASCVLRSTDKGESWQVSPTGSHGEIHQLTILNDNSVLSVGTLGSIHRSTDSGETWSAVRSAGYRSGLMNLVTELPSAAWQALASQSADLGVRTVVAQISPVLPPIQTQRGPVESPSELHALTQIGVAAVARESLFARSRPEEHRSQAQLLADWNRQTDGSLREMLPLRLARLIRIWRPSVLLLESMDTDDAVAGITREVLPEAIRLAQSTENDAAALENLFLQPWSVQRTVVRCAADRTSSLCFSDADLLPRLQTTAGILISAARQASSESEAFSSEPNERSNRSPTQKGRVCYELLSDEYSDATPPHLFHQINLRSGGEARRAIEAPANDELRKLQELVQKTRLESAALAGNPHSAKGDDAIIAELRAIGNDLPAALAVLQLQELAELQLMSNAVDAYLAVLQEIIRRFPDSPEAIHAAESLFLFYSSSEVRKFRLEHSEDLRENRRLASGLDPSDLQHALATTGLDTRVDIRPAAAAKFSGSAQDRNSVLMENWDRLAAAALETLRRREKAEIHSAIMLRLAANSRRIGKTGEQATLLSEVARRADEWSRPAAAETQSEFAAATPALPVINVQKTDHRPLLDGQFTDQCWEDAGETFLASADDLTAGPSNGNCLVLLSWDDEFLYVAGRVKHTSRPADPVAINRQHDQVHGIRDRIELEIDTDRDYSTGFVFRIDQTGNTSESCWKLSSWNPQWFVASASDPEVWRFEAAIPLKELLMTRAAAGDLWSIRLRRVAPGYLQESLQMKTETGVAHTTDGRGHLRLIRSQKKK